MILASSNNDSVNIHRVLGGMLAAGVVCEGKPMVNATGFSTLHEHSPSSSGGSKKSFSAKKSVLRGPNTCVNDRTPSISDSCPKIPMLAS